MGLREVVAVRAVSLRARLASEVSQANFYFFSFLPAKQEAKKQNP